MSLASGRKLGSYEIAALVGLGGMGEVYLAIDAPAGPPGELKQNN